MNWDTKTLGDLCAEGGGEVQTGPFGTQLHESDYSETGTPVIMPSDIDGSDVSTESIARVNEEHVERLDQHKVVPGDIVFPRRGDIKKHAYITDRESGWLCGTGCLRIRLGDSAVASRFLHYYLYYEPVVAAIESKAVGSTMANLNTSILEDLDVSYPPIREQEKIASLLSTYDDLIKINQERIEIIEQIVQTLYREWFVHYRFPGYEDVQMVDSPMGEIPDGWEVQKFTDVGDVLTGGTPKTKNSEYWGGNIPFFTPKDAHGGYFTHETEKNTTKLGVEDSSTELYPSRTIFITARGTVGNLALPAEPMALNQSCYALRAIDEFSQEFLFLLIQERVEYLKKNTGGATFDTIIIDTFRRMDVLVPPQGLVAKFTELVKPMFDLLPVLGEKNRILRQTRDLFLPRLISGELDLSELDIDRDTDT